MSNSLGDIGTRSSLRHRMWFSLSRRNALNDFMCGSTPLASQRLEARKLLCSLGIWLYTKIQRKLHGYFTREFFPFRMLAVLGDRFLFGGRTPFDIGCRQRTQ